MKRERELRFEIPGYGQVRIPAGPARIVADAPPPGAGGKYRRVEGISARIEIPLEDIDPPAHAKFLHNTAFAAALDEIAAMAAADARRAGGAGSIAHFARKVLRVIEFLRRLPPRHERDEAIALAAYELGLAHNEWRLKREAEKDALDARAWRGRWRMGGEAGSRARRARSVWWHRLVADYAARPGTSRAKAMRLHKTLLAAARGRRVPSVRTLRKLLAANRRTANAA